MLKTTTHRTLHNALVAGVKLSTRLAALIDGDAESFHAYSLPFDNIVVKGPRRWYECGIVEEEFSEGWRYAEIKDVRVCSGENPKTIRVVEVSGPFGIVGTFVYTANTPTAKREYAWNISGTALLAYDRWAFAKRQHDAATTDEDRMIYTGRCYAYSEILRHLTGRDAGVLTRNQLVAALGV